MNVFLRGSDFVPVNIEPEQVPECMSSFVLTASPNTDLWRRPPNGDITTAPMLYTTLRHAFCSAEVSISASWELEWDQAGLVIFAGLPPGHDCLVSASRSAGSTELPPYPIVVNADPTKWVKVALEYHKHKPTASAVCATSEGADWSVSTLPDYQATTSELRVKLERIGYALWIYYEDLQGGWTKVREIGWFFFGVQDKAIRVGVFASRPATWPYDSDVSRYGEKHLRVEFEGLQIF